MLTNDERQVKDRLQQHVDRINALMGILERGMSHGQREDARQRMKEIKERLREDAEAGRTVSGFERMTAAEQTIFHPAVNEAETRIHVRWNSSPNDRWLSELYDARISLTFQLDHLEDRE
jgi:hypothetical protein